MPTRDNSPGVHSNTDVSELARLVRQLYVSGPYLMRKMMHYRVRICPFERLIVHVNPGSSVLDVGCGSGLFLALLAVSTRHVTGVGFDSSAPAIETAAQMAERAKALGFDAELQFLRLEVAQPWPSGLFDVVSLIDVLHHVPPSHQKSVLERSTHSLKPNGILIYKDIANHPFLPAGMNRLHDLILARQWIHYVPIRNLEDWCRHLGLELTHEESDTRLWYRHELRVFRKPA